MLMRIAEEKHKRERPGDADRAEDPESVAPSVGRHRAEHARERARHDDAYVESTLVDGKRRRARFVVVLRDEGARGRRRENEAAENPFRNERRLVIAFMRAPDFSILCGRSA